MDHYVTGAAIRSLREKQAITQKELAQRIGVSDKAVSKWETGRGLPDISLLEPLSRVLNVSLTELLTGDCVVNTNPSANMLRTKFYVCPVCGNIIHTTGESAISCCGITLPLLEAEDPDEEHALHIEKVENETYVTISHHMTKQHYISFIAYVTSDKFEMVKQYPEGSAQARFLMRGHGFLYFYCNRHGLMKQRV
ncbi:MAG: helix-turn-helix domain-containing protein [Eubacteriales bacterium]|nr:helix-turn-helix domain-containing protein [Eubacteriales bacterium]